MFDQNKADGPKTPLCLHRHSHQKLDRIQIKIINIIKLLF